MEKFKKIFLCSCCFFWCSIKSIAQDSLSNKQVIYFRITAGGGIGKGYPQSEGQIGIGGSLEAAIQKKNNLYSLGIRTLGEFVLFNNTNVHNNINSADIMYGKVLSAHVFFCSISGGISYVYSEQEGDLISREVGWFFGRYNYQSIKTASVGLPLSFKTMWIPTKYYGIGIDFYANINRINSFYSINFCHQFGRLRPSRAKNNR